MDKFHLIIGCDRRGGRSRNDVFSLESADLFGNRADLQWQQLQTHDLLQRATAPLPSSSLFTRLVQHVL